MSYIVDSKYPKNGPNTTFDPSAGAKRIKVEMLRIGQPSDVGKAPPSRIYTRDYCKTPYDDTDKSDLVTEALGNPLRL